MKEFVGGPYDQAVLTDGEHQMTPEEIAIVKQMRDEAEAAGIPIPDSDAKLLEWHQQFVKDDSFVVDTKESQENN